MLHQPVSFDAQSYVEVENPRTDYGNGVIHNEVCLGKVACFEVMCKVKKIVWKSES